MKIALVYTSTTPELIELVEKEVKSQLPTDTEILSYKDATILQDVIDKGYVTTKPAAKLIDSYMKASLDGVDAILNICSSVGEVADSVQSAAKYIGVPIVRIDEEMCREAVRCGSKIAVMATLPTTLTPTKNTIKRVAREMNKEVELVDCLVKGAFGLNQDDFKKQMLTYAGQVASEVDVILFAQGSMAYCESDIRDEYNKTVLSSPRFGAIALRDALIAKGLVK
ncbi:MAG: aspartate/glutamate racemase family protein [Suipraeoptans sp.]